MRNVLEKLYYGNIRTDSRMYGHHSPFVQAAKLKSRHLDKLREILEDSGKEVFEKYCDAQGEIEGITRYGGAVCYQSSQKGKSVDTP